MFHLVLAYPSEFGSSLGIPTNLYYWYTTLFRSFDLLVHDFHRFLDEMEILVYFNFVRWNDESLVGQALLQVGHMEGVRY